MRSLVSQYSRLGAGEACNLESPIRADRSKQPCLYSTQPGRPISDFWPPELTQHVCCVEPLLSFVTATKGKSCSPQREAGRHGSSLLLASPMTKVSRVKPHWEAEVVRGPLSHEWPQSPQSSACLAKAGYQHDAGHKGSISCQSQ